MWKNTPSTLIYPSISRFNESVRAWPRSYFVYLKHLDLLSKVVFSFSEETPMDNTLYNLNIHLIMLNTFKFNVYIIILFSGEEGSRRYLSLFFFCFFLNLFVYLFIYLIFCLVKEAYYVVLKIGIFFYLRIVGSVYKAKKIRIDKAKKILIKLW